MRLGGAACGPGIGRTQPEEWSSSCGPKGLSTTPDDRLDSLNRKLKKGWTAHVNAQGRIFYCNHGTQTASWLPPADNWQTSGSGLPYGWEMAADKDGKYYYINHVNKTTTYEDPRQEITEDPPPEPRDVVLFRDQEMGFGFVAGSEKPVIVRFVTDGGPSVDKLLPGDQILKINGEEVRQAPREHVIELVRACKQEVALTVCQPHTCNLSRKSAILSAAKKAKLKNNPSRVRFAEGVVINGSPLLSPSSYSSESCIPFMPNVLKVFLENGQTKSFKYDGSTSVQDVVESLRHKLSIKCIDHFSLVVEHVKSLRRNKLTLLDPKESLARIAARPGAQHLRCLFRVAFVPKDAYELLRKDPVTFEYLYVQCCNDVVHERFAPELKYDLALRLAALHIHQHAISNNIQGKLSVKTIERECGLERFVPLSLVETMKWKVLRKLLGHFLKVNQKLSAPGQKSLTALQAKLHYLKIIAELPSYGAKCFSTTNIRDSCLETIILVSPKYGISQLPGIRNSTPITLAEIEDLSRILVLREDELSHRVELHLKQPEVNNIVLSLEDRDAEELVLLLQGYYHLLTDTQLPVHQERDRWDEDGAPPYHTQHRVQVDEWNYGNSGEDERTADLSTAPIYKPQTTNGHLPTTEKDAKTESPIVDRNMNKMAVGTLLPPPPPSNFRNGITGNRNLKPRIAPKPELGRVLDGDWERQLADKVELVEAKNEEVIRRVAEMQRIVDTAECYLTGKRVDVEKVTVDEDGPKPDCLEKPETRKKTDISDNLGPEKPRTGNGNENDSRLTPADSLLLLTQVGREMVDVSIPEVEIPDVDIDPSGSDTDSLSTPTDSPSHVQRLTQVTSGFVNLGSSFGLHSPDNLPPSMGTSTSNLRDLLRRLQLDSHLPYPFAEGTLYLDPDIIDLTMIPPPMTPDRDGFDLPFAVSMPPTPFADRGTLEAELRALEATFHQEAYSLQKDWADGSQDRPEVIGSPLRKPSPIILRSSSSPTAVRGSPSTPLRSPSFTPPLRHVGIDLPSPHPPPPKGWRSGDIDTFIANVAVPPPPPSSDVRLASSLTFPVHSPVVELTPEDISAFIIPPPPPTSTSSESDCEMIARLQEAAESTNEVLGVPGAPGTTPGVRRKTGNGGTQGRFHLQAPPSRPLMCKKPLTPEDSSGYDTQGSSTIGDFHEPGPSELSACILDDVRIGGLGDDASTVSAGSSGDHADAEDEGDAPPRPFHLALSREESGSSTGSSDTATSPFRRQMSLPRSVTSPLVARRGQWTNQRKTASADGRLPSEAANPFQDDATPERVTTHKPPLPQQDKRSPTKTRSPSSPVSESSTRKPLTYTFQDGPTPPPIPLPVLPKTPTKPLPPIPSHVNTSRDVTVNGLDSADSTSEVYSFVLDGDDVTRQLGTECPLRRAEELVEEMVARLDDILDTSRTSNLTCPDRDQLATARDALATEARRFVTASKLFVKSVAETSDTSNKSLTSLTSNVSVCISLLQRMLRATEVMASDTSRPVLTQNVALKVRDVLVTYVQTTRAASNAVGRPIDDPTMAGVMHSATTLAATLTALMRTLRGLDTS